MSLLIYAAHIKKFQWIFGVGDGGVFGWLIVGIHSEL